MLGVIPRADSGKGVSSSVQGADYGHYGENLGGMDDLSVFACVVLPRSPTNLDCSCFLSIGARTCATRAAWALETM